MDNRARTEQATTAWITVPFVSDEVIRPGPRSSAPTKPWDTNACQHRLQLRIIVPLSGRDDNRERSPFPVAGQMELGRQPSPAAPEPFITRMLTPFL